MRIWLKDLRNKKGWTQTETAKRLKMSRQLYNFIENGARQKDMTISLGSKLSDLFNIPLSTIRNFEEALAEDREEAK